MWIFNKHGFFSAVEHRDDNTKVMVRARVAEDISYLESVLWDYHGEKVESSHTPDGDYHYRLTVSKEIWGKYLEKVAAELDYDNFKNSVHGQRDRDSAYMGVWSAMYGFQDTRIPRDESERDFIGGKRIG
jgi:hypothetical protein